MGHHHQAAGVARPALLQVAGQPCDALDVEVVGGFVEGDDIPVADQQRRELHPPALTTGEHGYRCVPVEVGQQAADHVADPRIAGPLVLGAVADQRGGHGAVGLEGVRLVQRGHLQPATAGHPSGVRLDPAGEHAEQTGLAVAVSPDDSDAGAVVDADGHGVEHHLRRILEVQGFGPQQMCHWHDPIGATMRGRNGPEDEPRS